MNFLIRHNNRQKVVSDPMDVYEYVVESVYKKDMVRVDTDTHNKAADAQGWCELATAGEEYTGENFSIEAVYKFNV